jgi:DNA-binding Xre family transcriptional regulator
MLLDSTTNIRCASGLLMQPSGQNVTHPYNLGMASNLKFPKKIPVRHFIRGWRKHRHLTLEQLAERIGVTHGALSQLERGLTNYTQPMLEALAGALMCEPADLIMRDPSDPDGIWSIWDQAKPGERRQIVAVAKTLMKTGSES